MWHLVGDGENISRAVEVRFDIIWQPAGGDEMVVATVSHSFPAASTMNNDFRVVEFATDVPGIAVPAAAGDKLIYRFNTVGGAAHATFTPNGDGMAAGANVPNLTLP